MKPVARSRGEPPAEPVYARDAELLAACRRGDESAWRTLLGRYQDLIYSVPRRYGLDADDAADVFQAVCLALWKGLPELRSEKALTSWIQVTTRRQSERLALAKRRRTTENLDGNITDPGPPASEQVVRIEEEHRVRRALERLGGRCARLLGLLYMEDPPPGYEDISRRLGLPRGSIGPTRGRCLDKLRQMLKP